jgi:hypothetical protein
LKPKFTIVTNIESDIWNWQDVAKVKVSYRRNFFDRMPKSVDVERIPDKKYLRAYLKKQFYQNDAVEKYAEYIRAAFDGTHISDDLKKLTGFGLDYEEIRLGITTFQRCPYNANKGTLYIICGASARYVTFVTYHECMHMIVHNHFWNLFDEAGLNNTQAHDIKEALTVLLNPILVMRDLPEDKGYQIHQKLRDDITRLSKKGFSFENIIRETIKIYQKNPISK